MAGKGLVNNKPQFLPSLAVVAVGSNGSGSPCSIMSTGGMSGIAPPPTPILQQQPEQLPQSSADKESNSLVLPPIICVDGNMIRKQQVPPGLQRTRNKPLEHHQLDSFTAAAAAGDLTNNRSVSSLHCTGSASMSDKPKPKHKQQYYSQQAGIRPILSATATLTLLSSIDFRELRESFLKRSKRHRNQCGDSNGGIVETSTGISSSKCAFKEKTCNKRRNSNHKQPVVSRRAMLKPRYSSLVIEGLSIKNPYRVESPEPGFIRRSSSEIALPTYQQTTGDNDQLGGKLKRQRSVSMTSLNRVVIEFNPNQRRRPLLLPNLTHHAAGSTSMQFPQKQTMVAANHNKRINWKPNTVSFTVTAPLPPLEKHNLAYKPKLTQVKKPLMEGYLARKRISSEMVEFPNMLTLPNAAAIRSNASNSSSYVSRSTHLRQGNKSKIAEYDFKMPQRYPDLSVSGEHIQSYSDLSQMVGSVIQTAFYTVNAMIENSEERLQKLRQQRKERRRRRRQLRKLAGLSTESSTESDTYSDDDDEYDSDDSINALFSASGSTNDPNMSSLDKATAAAKRKSKRQRNRQRLKKMAQMLGGGAGCGTDGGGAVDVKQQLRKKRLIEKLRKKGINVVSEEEAEKIIMLAMADMSQLEILEIMDGESGSRKHKRKERDKRKRQRRDEEGGNDRGSDDSRRSRRRRRHERRKDKRRHRGRTRRVVNGEEVSVSDESEESGTDEDRKSRHHRRRGQRRGRDGRRHHRGKHRRRRSSAEDGESGHEGEDDVGSGRSRRRRRRKDRERRRQRHKMKRRGQGGQGGTIGGSGLTDTDEYSSDYYTSSGDEDYSSDYTYGSSEDWDSSSTYTSSNTDTSSGYSDSDDISTSDNGSGEGRGTRKKKKKKGLSRKQRRRAARHRRRAEGSVTESSTVYSTEYDSDGNVVSKGAGKRRRRRRKGGKRRRRGRGDSATDYEGDSGSKRKRNKRKHRDRKGRGEYSAKHGSVTESALATEGPDRLEISRPSSTITKPPTTSIRTPSGRLITATQHGISGPMEHDRYSNALAVHKNETLYEEEMYTELNEEEKKLLRQKIIEESLLNDFDKEETEMRRIRKIQKEARIKAQQEMYEKKQLEEHRAELAYTRKQMEKQMMVKQLEKLQMEIETRRSFHLYHRAVVDEYYDCIEKWDEVDFAVIESHFGFEYREQIVNIDKERKLAEAILMEQFFMENFELKRQELLIKLKQAHERFTEELATEILGLDSTAKISRAFVTSYFSILDNHNVLY